MLSAFGKGLLGAVVMAFSLGTAITLGQAANVHLGVDSVALQLVEGVVCSVLATTLIVMSWWRLERLPLRTMGLSGPRVGLPALGLGAALTAGAATLTFGLGAAAGWITFGELALPQLARFLILNALVAFLSEALPEEVSLRGYTYRTLSTGVSRWVAAVLTTMLFLAVPAMTSMIQVVEATMLGTVPPPLHIAPGGQDPAAYLILLTFFGTTLVVARVVTGSVWTTIGVHLVFLTVNRLVLSSPNDGSGWSASFTTPDAVLLIPAYLLVATIAFLLYARRLRLHGGWREREP